MKHNLPQQLTTFVGRRDALQHSRALLEKSRLLTMTGSGGIGKTRLGLELASEWLDRSKDGVWFIELAPLKDSGLVAQTVASGLGVREQPGIPILRTLVGYLRLRELLIFIDNCEHVLTDAATVVETLLHGCPNLTILASSREALGIAGEVAYRVPSLSLPDAGQTEGLAEFESVRLFIDRAVFASPAFAVTTENAPALASICRRLDGIPLAIELAAARVRAVPIQEVDRRLDQRFRLLGNSNRTSMPRQQTLRSLIDWSFDLLNKSEQTLFQRLAVFAGGWTVEAAERVCAGGAIEEWGVLDLLSSLVDKSLATSEQTGDGIRFGFLQTVRQYSQERFDEDFVNSQHLAFFLGFVEKVEPYLTGADQQLWLDKIETEHDNIRAALSYAFEHDPESALRICGSMRRFWSLRGYFAEGRRQCDTALLNEDKTLISANAHSCAGALAWKQGDYASAQNHHEQALAIRTQQGDKRGVSQSLIGLGVVALDHGDFPTAKEYYEKSLAIAEELEDRLGLAVCLCNLGVVAFQLGDHETTQSYYEKGLAVQRELGDRSGIAYTLNNLGNLAFVQKNFERSRTFFQEAAEMRREIGDLQGIGYCLHNLGDVAFELGELEAARSLYAEGLKLRQDLGDRHGIVSSLESIAALSAAKGFIKEAIRLFSAADSIREEMAAPMSEIEQARAERWLSEARKTPEFDALWNEGAALSFEAAIESAAAALNLGHQAGSQAR